MRPVFQSPSARRQEVYIERRVILIEASSIRKIAVMGQTWSSKTYAENARFVSDLSMPVVEWLTPKAGERILDLGCGDGDLTVKLRDFGCEVIGVDSSPDFINSAKSLGLDARLDDNGKGKVVRAFYG